MTTNDTSSQVNPSREAVRALVVQSGSKLIASVADRINAQAVAEITQARQINNQLKSMHVGWLDANTSEEMVMVFARTCVALGLNPLVGQAYLIHGAFYVGIAGRRKLASGTHEWRGESAPRLLTPSEMEIHDVKEGDWARAVDVWREGWRTPATGFGIITKAEHQAASDFTPLFKQPAYMAFKRAAANAYKIAFPDIDIPVVDVPVVDYIEGEVVNMDTGRPLIESGFTERDSTEAYGAGSEEHNGEAEDAEGHRSSGQSSSTPPPPPAAIEVPTDVQSLILWCRTKHDKTPDDLLAALHVERAGQLAAAIKAAPYNSDYAEICTALDALWATDEVQP